MKNNLRVTGVMSGTSLDGVDLAYVEFSFENNQWNYDCKRAETIAYPERWRVRLSQLDKQPMFVFPKTHRFYGKYLGQLCREFIQKNNLTVDLISSHGHTIFHQPEAGFTAQIGDGASIHAETNLPVVCDFRTTDVALGGQGAPLVPIGDKLLFSNYDACLNLGGIANISFTKDDEIKAFDISPCNIVFNRVARLHNLEYDENGNIAASGNANAELLNVLNDLDYYHLQTAKSLGKEWIDEVFFSVVQHYSYLNNVDLMATFSAHIAQQIAETINRSNVTNVLVTGGGALNTHLINNIRKQTSATIEIPDLQTVNFKEAIIFAFLGALRVNNLNNALKSVTGATRDNIGGAVYGDFSALTP